MSKLRKKIGWLIVSGLVLAVVAALLGVYVWGYYAMGHVIETPLSTGNTFIRRVYDKEWKEKLFRPAANVDSFLTGNKVFTESDWVYMNKNRTITKQPMSK